LPRTFMVRGEEKKKEKRRGPKSNHATSRMETRKEERKGRKKQSRHNAMETGRDLKENRAKSPVLQFLFNVMGERKKKAEVSLLTLTLIKRDGGRKEIAILAKKGKKEKLVQLNVLKGYTLPFRGGKKERWHQPLPKLRKKEGTVTVSPVLSGNKGEKTKSGLVC